MKVQTYLHTYIKALFKTFESICINIYITYDIKLLILYYQLSMVFLLGQISSNFVFLLEVRESEKH